MAKEWPDGRRGNWWGVTSGVAWLAGVVVGYASLGAVAQYGTREELKLALTVAVLVGTLVVGVGTLLRSGAHGDRTLATIDGIGKVLGVFGWALGIIGVIFLANDSIEIPFVAVAVGIGTIVLIGVAHLVWAIKRGDPGAPHERANEAAADGTTDTEDTAASAVVSEPGIAGEAVAGVDGGSVVPAASAVVSEPVPVVEGSPMVADGSVAVGERGAEA